MSRRIFNWVGIVLGSLIGLIALLVTALYFVGNERMTKKYTLQPEALTIPSDTAAIENGRRWASSLGCTSCHGADLSGTVLIDDPMLGYIPSPNVTLGEGGVGEEFTDGDWVLSIRHGIDPREGRAFLAMPSSGYYYLTDEDLGELIAFLKNAPPVDKDLGEIRPTFMTKVLIAAGAFGENALPAENIDHTGARPAVIPPDTTAEYGDYLVRVLGCRDCHGADLAGGKHPEPGAPSGPNITPGGSFGDWSLENFLVAVHTRESKYMPWKDLKHLNVQELEASYLYLQSLPALADAIR